MFSGEIGKLAATNIVRSCPDDWKQGDGEALARWAIRSFRKPGNGPSRRPLSRNRPGA
jgi:hypothetical protein